MCGGCATGLCSSDCFGNRFGAAFAVEAGFV